jgi:hypothetical protein
MGSHQSARALTCVWLTPPPILAALGPFDLDPCAAGAAPWPTASRMLTAADDGLAHEWSGRVWLNPPYGPPGVIGPWMRRMAAHGVGTALIFARTETALFFETVWRGAHGVLFLEGRLHFHHADGRRAAANAGAPSVLVAYGADDLDRMAESGLAGHLVPLRLPRVVLVAALDGSWRDIVADWLRQQRGPVSVSDAYRAFARHPKALGRRHVNAKIRQTLQRGAGRCVGRDRWVAA